MAKSTAVIEVYLEEAKKKTIAGALEWPGWCRAAKDEDAARQALVDYAPRYAAVLKRARIDFQPPSSVQEFKLVERIDGDASTDYGVPGKAPKADTRPFDAAEFKRSSALLRACWQALDAAAEAAKGKELSKGPRGGGRELEGILRHELDSEKGYLSRLRHKVPKPEVENLAAEQAQTRQSVLDALEAIAHGEIPGVGPRGGQPWSARYFVRRAAWHILDHAWEIEDRAD